PLLLVRGQLRGRIADYLRADELSRALVKSAPRLARAHEVRASVLTTLHRFAEAGRELDRAQALGSNPVDLQPARTALLEATGRTAEAQEQRARALANPDVPPDLAGRAAMAVLEA